MTIRATSFAKYSLACGAASAFLVPTSAVLSTYRWSGSSAVVELATQLGIVSEPKPGSFNNFSSPGLLALHDEKALFIMATLGVLLALAAVLFAVLAEVKQDSNLYLSAGLVSGCCSLAVWNPLLGLVVTFLGIAAVIKVRYRAQA